MVFGGGLIVISIASYAFGRPKNQIAFPVGPVKVIAIGDSLTAGKVYCANLKELFPAGSSIQCIGEESAGVKRVQQLATQGYLPGADYVIVLVGVNDLASGRSISTIISGLEKIYDLAHSVGAKVIAVTLTPWLGHSKGGKLNQETRDVNSWIRNQSNADIVVETTTLGHAGYLLPDYNAGDGLHLSAAGQRALANAVVGQTFGGVA